VKALRATVLPLAGAIRRLPPLQLVPLLLVAGLLPWLALCVPNYVDQPLWRDPGVFQYVAWCIRRGERLYDGIVMPDGPLVYMIHIPIQLFTGTSDAAFRAVDFGLHASISMLMGALLAGTVPGTRGVAGRAVWALVLCAVWMANVVSPGIGPQREAYYALLGSLAIVLAWVAPFHAARGREVASFLAGFFSMLVAFGKHSGIVYVALAAMTLVLGARPGDPRWGRMRSYGLGIVGATALVLLFVACVGSLRGMAFWYFAYPFEVHRYILAIPAGDVLTDVQVREAHELALTTTVGGIAAIVCGLLPRASAGIFLAPALQCAAAILQRKGWMYHNQPAVFGAFLALVVGFLHLWSREEEDDGRPRVLGWIALVLVFACTILTLGGSIYLNGGGPMHLHEHDYDMRQRVSRFLREQTGPADRVFYYGIDPHTLYLAQRLPASPYSTVSFVLDFAPALAPPPPPAGAGPGPEARRRIEELQRVVADDMCDRVIRSPPRAMVFTSIPPNTGPDAVADVVGLCSALGPMLGDRYGPPTEFSETRVYLRRD
jgi:hypothetical protein